MRHSTPGPSFALLLLVAILGWQPAPLHAEEPPAAPETESIDAAIARMLLEAKMLENTQGKHHEARLKYEELLFVSDYAGQLTAEQRGDALRGRARCAVQEGSTELAAQIWEAIVADDALPDDVRGWARGELDRYRASTAPDREDLHERLREERRAEDRRRAEALYERARLALDRHDSDKALTLALEARALDPASTRIEALLREISASRPDRGELLESLMRFVETRSLSERSALEGTLDDLERAGRSAFTKTDWKRADHLFRDAVHRIDASGFLEIGVAREFESLLGRRQRFVTWLQRVHEKAKGSEQEFAVIPPMPPPSERTAGLQGQLYGVLARLFREPERPDEALRFHPFASRRTGRGKRPPTLSSQVAGVRVSQRPSQLTRATWAHAWIEREMGSVWLDPRATDFDALRERARRRGRPLRLLARFGDMVAVQHKPAMHRRIAALSSAFEANTPRMVVDVHLLAATGPGVVRVEEALELRAQRGSSGFAFLHEGRLVGMAAELVSELEGVRALGHATIDLNDQSATHTTWLQSTGDHPMFAKVPLPKLTLAGDNATYGLHLDLYAEDLPFAQSGLPRSAVSVLAHTRMPTHSSVLPRLEEGEGRFRRVPRMGIHKVDAHVELAHFGTLVLLGLPNPFVPAAFENHELIVLMGVRRADEPIPDAPPEDAGRVVPSEGVQQEHALGRLALDIEDTVLARLWPESGPPDEGDRWQRREARSRYLARLLARMANLETPNPGDVPVSIEDGKAVATLHAAEHTRLSRAAARVRACESDLYRIEIESAVLPRTTTEAWSTLRGAMRARGGGLRLLAPVAKQVREAIQAARKGPGLFDASEQLFAHPTQLVAMRRLVERTLVRDVQVREVRGKQVLLPELGRVAQGLIVEVRPNLEDTEQALRTVDVRARAARWRDIVRSPHPSDPEGAIEVSVPAWAQGNAGPASEDTASDVLSDDGALVLLMPVPDADHQRIAVWVQVRKVPGK